METKLIRNQADKWLDAAIFESKNGFKWKAYFLPIAGDTPQLEGLQALQDHLATIAEHNEDYAHARMTNVPHNPTWLHKISGYITGLEAII